MIIEVLSAITTACYFHLYHRWCSSDRHLRFQQWDQPHVLDRWCVGLACCFLLRLVRGAFAYQFRCCTSLVISGDFTSSDRKSFRRSWPANKKFGQFRIRHLRFVQCLIVASFLHSGEASNPGPKSSSRRLTEPGLWEHSTPVDYVVNTRSLARILILVTYGRCQKRT